MNRSKKALSFFLSLCLLLNTLFGLTAYGADTITVSGTVVIATTLDGTGGEDGIGGIDIYTDVTAAPVGTSASDGSFSVSVPVGTTALTLSNHTFEDGEHAADTEGCTIDRTVTLAGDENVEEVIIPVIICDWNSDGSVSPADSGVFARAMNSSEGDSNYNVYCNLNGDHSVTPADKGIFARFIGNVSKAYTYPELVLVTPFSTNIGVKLENTESYLYRAGNANNVALFSLFKAENASRAIDSSGVSVTVENVAGNAAGTYTKNTSDWTASTLKFSGTGVVKLTVLQFNTDTAETVEAASLYLEIVNATNATAAMSVTASRNVVLLNDITATSLSVSGGTLYGNGFTIDASACTNGNNNNIINLSNGTLNNVKIIGPNYDNAAVYSTKDSNFVHTVSTSGDCYIYNCYIAYSRAPIQVLNLTGSGATNIENTVLDGGRYGNIFVKAGNLNLHNVTTISQPRATKSGNMRCGFGIVITDEATNVEIHATGYLKQYNWVGKTTDKSYFAGDNSESSSNTVISNLFNYMFSKAGEFAASYNGDSYMNTGILCLNSNIPKVTGEAVSAYSSKNISIGSYDGWVMTENGTSSFDASEALKYRSETVYDYSEQIPYVPTFTWSYPSSYKDGAVNLSYDEGGSVEFDPNILTVTKYGNTLPATVTMNGTDYTGRSITFNTAGEYTVNYTVTDPYNFDHTATQTESRTYVKSVTVKVSEIKASIKAPEFTFYNTSGTSLGSKIVEINGAKYVMPNVSATSDYVKSVTVGGQTVYCPVVESRFKDNSSDFNYLFDIFTGVNIKNYTNTSGSSVTYSKSTNISSLPSGLTWITTVTMNGKGWDSYARDSSYGLYRKSAAIGSNQSEQTRSVQFSFEAGNGETYYYYIYYHAASHKCPSGCVAEGAQVTMADGSTKPIEEIQPGEMVMTWSMYNGRYEAQPVVLNLNHGKHNWDVLTLQFSDGTEVRSIYDHGYFDADLNTYAYINNGNVSSFVGDRFIKRGETGQNETVVLTGYTISTECVESYTLVSAYNYNCFVNGILSHTSEDGRTGFYEFFEMGDNLTYDAEKMQADIEKYGLYTYDDFRGYLTEEQFELLNFKYYKINVGKGIIAYSDIVEMLELYME